MSREEVRAFDAWAIGELGFGGVVLMENAGRSCAEFVAEVIEGGEEAKVRIFCGKGNNGGDGYVIARHLLGRGYDVRVFLVGRLDEVKGDAKVNLDLLLKIGGVVEEFDIKGEDIAAAVRKFAADADMIVDCIFGTGLVGQLREGYIELIEAINSIGARVLAVDIPSGLDCDSGEPLGVAVKADDTVTFVAAKKGFIASSKFGDYTGNVYVASIGVTPLIKSRISS
ncbi:MAG: NAD(P)H-hydrate epimerase [Phycisphaerae bacterium]|nr:NAD(P)H-hydrate epimerase [Phycisphaerae bacterium]